MPRMKGADLITEHLVRNKIPYVFGICGHGNVGMLDSLYGARDQIKLVSPRHEQVAAHMADAYFRVRHEPVATLTSCGPGSANIVMPLQVALSDSSALLAITANVPTSAVQPLAVPGDQPALPGRLRQRDPPGGEALVPADARRHAAARAAPGDDHDAVRPPGPGEYRRAVQRVPGGGRRRGAAGLAAARRAAQRRRAGRDRGRARPDPAAQAAGALRRPRRHALGGEPRADRARAQARHPGDLVAERLRLHRHDRSAVARLHRPQRRLSGQPGRPPCRRGDRDRRALRRPLGLVVAAGLFVEFPARQADPCRRRSGRARPQLSARSRHPGRRAHLPAPAARRARAAASRARAR